MLPIEGDSPSDRSSILAVCQAPDGPGDYVPHHSETCFMDCDCKPRHYVAVDALLSHVALEAAVVAHLASPEQSMAAAQGDAIRGALRALGAELSREDRPL